MAEKWTHAGLGTFTFDDPDWITKVKLPSFKRFTYREFGRNCGRASLQLSFSPVEFDSKDLPSKPAITVALRIIRNQDSLAEKVEKSIWQDINGRGRGTGMWWHGGLPDFDQTFSEPFGSDLKRILQSRESVRCVIGEPRVCVVESVSGFERPCAKLSFSAAFDPEHGVGVLTDGNRILGIGYGYDVGPYEA